MIFTRARVSLVSIPEEKWGTTRSLQSSGSFAIVWEAFPYDRPDTTGTIGTIKPEKPAPLKTPSWEANYNYEQLFM